MICNLEDDSLEIIDITGLSEESLCFLSRQRDRVEILLLWIQRAIVDASQGGVLTVAPPILSRSFQELSRGAVHLHDLRKISSIQFPFPYSQLIQLMLMVHWAMMPFIAASFCKNIYWAGSLSFLVTTAFWSLVYIAREIDQPFGDDANDFDLTKMQQAMNDSLLTLLHPLSQVPPSLLPTADLQLVSSNTHIVSRAEAERMGKLLDVRQLFAHRRKGNNTSSMRSRTWEDEPRSSSTISVDEGAVAVAVAAAVVAADNAAACIGTSDLDFAEENVFAAGTRKQGCPPDMEARLAAVPGRGNPLDVSSRRRPGIGVATDVAAAQPEDNPEDNRTHINLFCCTQSPTQTGAQRPSFIVPPEGEAPSSSGNSLSVSSKEFAVV